MKKTTRRQVDKLFIMYSHDLYDKFIESAVSLYANLFPEKCSPLTFDDAYYDMVRQRLLFEFNVLYAEARGEKNVKNKFKKASSKKAKNKSARAVV